MTKDVCVLINSNKKMYQTASNSVTYKKEIGGSSDFFETKA